MDENLLRDTQQAPQDSTERFKAKFKDFMPDEEDSDEDHGNGKDYPSAIDVRIRNAKSTIYGRKFMKAVDPFERKFDDNDFYDFDKDGSSYNNEAFTVEFFDYKKRTFYGAI